MHDLYKYPKKVRPIIVIVSRDLKKRWEALAEGGKCTT